jgi:DNA-binding MarR family transcriptional regulator
LAAAPRGRLRAFELRGATQLEKSRLHHQLTCMAKRGLLARERAGDTPRGAVIALSDGGRAAIEQALPRRAAHVRRWVPDPLDADHVAALVDASQTLQANLRANAPESHYQAPKSSRA